MHSKIILAQQESSFEKFNVFALNKKANIIVAPELEGSRSEQMLLIVDSFVRSDCFINFSNLRCKINSLFELKTLSL